MTDCIRVLVLVIGIILSIPESQVFGDQPSQRPQITAYRCDKSPIIDGNLSDDAWKHAGKAPFLAPTNSLRNAIYTCYDKQGIYIAVICEEPYIASAKCRVMEPDSQIWWNDECVQVILSPADISSDYYQIVVNLGNSRADGKANIPGIWDRSWNGKWTSAVKKGKNGWVVEIDVPFAVLDQKQPGQGTNWGFHVSRNRSNKNTSYSNTFNWNPNFDKHSSDLLNTWGKVRFEENTSVAVKTLGDFFPGQQKMVFDMTGRPAEIFVYSKRGSQVHRILADTLQPSQHQVTWDEAFNDEKMAVEIKLSSGELLYASGWVSVNQDIRKLVQWIQRVDDSDKIKTDFWKLTKNIEQMDGSFKVRHGYFEKRLKNIIEQTREKQFQRMMVNGPRDANGEPAYGVATASSMSKILPQCSEFDQLNFKPYLEFAAAKNEMEAGQIVIYSPKKDLKQVTVSIGELTSETGGVISRSAVTAAVVGFVKTSKPVYEVDYVGWWPDPIMTNLHAFDIRKGDLQSIWVSVRVPIDAQAGNYKSTLTIKPENAVAMEIPVHLEVWNFTLPKQSSLPTAVSVNTIDVYRDEINNKSRIKHMTEAFDRFMLEHRTNPGQLYRSSPPDEETLVRWDKLGTTDFNIREIRKNHVDLKTMKLRPELAEQVREQVSRTLKIIEKNQIKARPYIYVFDEAGFEYFPALENITAWLNKEFPGIYTLTTSSDISCGTQTGIKSLKAFCPLTSVYNTKFTDLSRRQGHDVWWYVCCGPSMPFANMLLEYPAIDTRLLMGFMPFAYNVDGFLYYRMTAATNNKGKRLVEGPYTNWNPRSYGEYNGDGFLIYPGQTGPISSIRMENWEDGLEDYEYLKLIENRIDQLRRRGNKQQADKLQAVLERFAKPGNNILNDLTNFTDNPKKVEEARQILVQLILQTVDK